MLILLLYIFAARVSGSLPLGINAHTQSLAHGATRWTHGRVLPVGVRDPGATRLPARPSALPPGHTGRGPQTTPVMSPH